MNEPVGFVKCNKENVKKAISKQRAKDKIKYENIVEERTKYKTQHFDKALLWYKKWWWLFLGLKKQPDIEDIKYVSEFYRGKKWALILNIIDRKTLFNKVSDLVNGSAIFDNYIYLFPDTIYELQLNKETEK